jgi:hypothetical protein
MPSMNPKGTVELFEEVFGVEGLSGRKPGVLIRELMRLCLEAPLLGVEKLEFGRSWRNKCEDS